MTAEEHVDSIGRWTNGGLRAAVIQMVREAMLEAAEHAAREMRQEAAKTAIEERLAYPDLQEDKAYNIACAHVEDSIKALNVTDIARRMVERSKQ